MSEKVPCKQCGVLVLPMTANSNDGLCMPCKNGYREQIEKSKAYYAKERELDKTCPFRALWRQLVDNVHNQPGGFESLSEEEKIYFSVGLLDGETYNGGLIQFFDNSSGAYYRYAEMGLVRLGAVNSLSLLRAAKKKLFGNNEVPKDRSKRWEVMRSKSEEPELDKLDEEYYKDLDNIGARLDDFAKETGLVDRA